MRCAVVVVLMLTMLVFGCGKKPEGDEGPAATGTETTTPATSTGGETTKPETPTTDTKTYPTKPGVKPATTATPTKPETPPAEP